MRHVEDRWTHAAKQYHCWHCAGAIEAGEMHVDRIMSDGEAYHMHAHTDCTTCADAFWATQFDFGQERFPPLAEDEGFGQELEKWRAKFPGVVARVEARCES